MEALILAGTRGVQDVAASSLTGALQMAAWSLMVKQEVEASTLSEALAVQEVEVLALPEAQEE